MLKTIVKSALAVAVASGILAGCTKVHRMESPCVTVMPPVCEPAMADKCEASPAAPAAGAGGEGKAEAALAVAAGQVTGAPAVRQLIYNGELTLVVRDVECALKQLRELAEKAGGYMQSMTSGGIVLRVPSARFQEALQLASGLGAVTSQEIKGDDVTAELWDLDIRIRNKEALRDRLLKLAEKGGKVEELVKIEEALAAATEEIERMKGRLKFLRHNVEFSTLTVKLNSPVAEVQAVREKIPFGWVRRLACEDELAPQDSYSPETYAFGGLFHRPWLKAEFPAGYVVVEENNCRKILRALSGEGVSVLVRREDNFKEGTQAFWSGMIRRHLAASLAIALEPEKELALASGAKAAVFSGTRQSGGKTYRYVLATVTTRRHVHTVECWGPDEAVGRDLAGLEKMVRSLDVKD